MNPVGLPIKALITLPQSETGQCSGYLGLFLTQRTRRTRRNAEKMNDSKSLRISALFAFSALKALLSSSFKYGTTRVRAVRQGHLPPGRFRRSTSGCEN